MRHPRNAIWSRYVDDDIPAGSRSRLEMHLSQCERCRRMVEAFGRLGDAARATRPPEWSAKAFRNEFENRALAKNVHTGRFGWIRPAAASLGIVLAVSAGCIWAVRWNYRVDLERQTAGFVAEHYAARLGELAAALGEGRP